MICPNCGRETSGKFCPNCGTKLNAEPAEPRPNDPAAVPDQSYAPIQSYAPRQSDYTDPAPSQDYAGNPSYVPSSQAASYQTAPVGALGQTPAIQMLRKIATSPVYLLAVLFFSLSLVFTVYINVKNIIASFDAMDYYKSRAMESELISPVVSSFVTVLLNLLIVIALWSMFVSAAAKNKERMSTGGLTFFQVLYGFYMTAAILALGFVLVLLVMLIVSDQYSSFFQDAVNELNYLVNRSGYEFPSMNVTLRVFLYIFLGSLLVGLTLAAVYFVKLFKTLATAKRVIRTGAPDDRVSVFVGVITILGAVFTLISGVEALTAPHEIMQLMSVSRTAAILYGVSLLLNAVASACFALTLFRFRGGMRSLGVYKGVMQR